MSKIQLLGKLLGQYKLWTLKLISSSKDIENNILQKGSGKDIEEKIMSIGIASITVYIGTGILSMFGVYTGGFIIGVVFFAIGLLLSKYINKKIFGEQREIDDLKEDEKTLLKDIERVNNTHKDIREKINNKTIIVNFIDYATLSNQFKDIVNHLHTYNTNHLAYKYRLNHKVVTTKYKKQIKRFDEIYAHK